MPTPRLDLVSISRFYFRRISLISFFWIFFWVSLPLSAAYQVLLGLLAGGGGCEGAQKPREMTLLLCMCPS